MEKRRKKNYLFLILSILLIVLFTPYAVGQMNDAVIRNVQMAGDETAHVYGLNEVITSNQYETILETMEYQLRPVNRTAGYTEMLRKYLEFVTDVMKLGDVEAYAVIDGTIYSASYWEEDEEYDPEETEWYQKAIEAEGEIIYTDAYEDARLNKMVMTLAKQIKGTEDVVAVDVYPSYEKKLMRDSEAPDGTNYYICDSKGTLVAYTVDGVDREELQEKFYSEVFQKIIKQNSGSRITGVDGVERGVYFYRLDSGYYSVITIPYASLLEPYDEAWGIFTGVIAVFVLTVAVFAVVDFRTNRKAALYNEIIGVLGNSYYAIYQIHLQSNQYYMLKGSDYVRGRIPGKGSYSELLSVMEDVIRESDYAEFVRTFSVDNITELVKKRVRDFGGDFKRMFNGEYRWVHVQMLYDESLQKGTVVLAFRDVNEAKEEDLSRLELLKTSLNSADSLAKSKNMFFSQMSHDMRTPLNGIIGLTGLAQKKVNDPQSMKDTLEKIRQLGSQLLELINEILDISRIEAGKLEIRSESFRIRKNLEDLAAIYRMQIEGSGKTFRVNLDIEDVSVESDWGKLQQILNNILSNAVKFTDKDGVIEFGVTETKDSNSRYRKYCFRISDNGSGMSREFLDRLFIPFEREVQFGAAKVAGTGLGMPIVHELVQKMSGTIEVESELGKGSVFEVTIPCLASETETEAQVEKQDESPCREENCLEGRRVLVAEDNMINMEIMTEMLGTFGIEVEQAWDGKQAVEVYESHDPGWFDLILLDMQMPVMDGCEAAGMIRRSKRADARTVPIIAVTANAFAEDIALTKKAGMNAHISKPIDFGILKETMEKLIL